MGCIHTYFPEKPSQPCLEPNGCANGCQLGQYAYSYYHSYTGCQPNQSTCVNSPEYEDWSQTSIPELPASCDNPWSAQYVDCEQAPEPNQCNSPSNNVASTIGDPVDLASGSLEYEATDLDLGRGLAFGRHYSSERAGSTSVGSGWEHNLGWRLDHDTQTSGTTNAEFVVVHRPLASKVAFLRFAVGVPISNEAWKGSMRGEGHFSGSTANGFVYADDDGTRVTFSGTTFELTQIQPPGEAPITVTPAGSTTTYTRGGASFAATQSGGKVQSVSGGGQTWTYEYDIGGCLRTVNGWDPADPSIPVAWSYIYPFYNNNAALYCTSTELKAIERTAAGSTSSIASWGYDQLNHRYISADEPALDQSLSFSYTGESGSLVAEVRDGSSNLLATYTCQDGTVQSVSGIGGPGADVPFAAATLVPLQQGAPPRVWRTKTDENGNKTLLENHDERERPRIVTEGWIDENGNDEIDGSEAYGRRRTYTYDATVEGPLTVSETSVLNAAGARVETSDYVDPSNPTAGKTDRVYKRKLDGWTLDENGAQVAFTDTTEYKYSPDPSHRLTEIKGPYEGSAATPYLGPLTRIEYDLASGSRSAIKRYPAGESPTPLTWTFSSFDARGNPQTVTDPNSRTTAFTYDTLGRVLTAKPPCETAPCTGADDTTVTFKYGIDGNLVRVQFPDDSNGKDVVLDFGYDPAKPSQLRFIKESEGLVNAEGEPISAGPAIVYTYEKGRVTREERYSGFTNLASPGTRVGDASFSYTTAGRLLRAFNPLFAAGNVFSEFAHDDKGNVTAISDENADHASGGIDPLRHDTLGYDALDRLTEIQQIREMPNLPPATFRTRFEYDSLSNVKQVTDAKNRDTFLRHDDRGNLVESDSPDTGVTRFAYDPAGNLVAKLEAPGTPSARLTAYEYDGLNRLTKIVLPNDPDWIFSYDTGTAEQNRKGRLASVSNGVVTTSFEYTARGDVRTERTTIGGLSYDVGYTYDAAGNRRDLVMPSGHRVETEYAGLRPRRLRIEADPRVATIDAIEWYPFGPRTSAVVPPSDATGNKVKSTRGVNLRGQIDEVKVERIDVAPAVLLHRRYTYHLQGGGVLPNDPGPNLDRVEDLVPIDPAAPESRLYFYDGDALQAPLDRLRRASNLQGTPLFQYSYDEVGNVRFQSRGSVGSSFTYEDGTNRLDRDLGTEARDFEHDAHANRIYEGEDDYAGTASLRYDDANRLVEVRDPENGFASVVTYTYDAFGRRVRKDLAGDADGQLPVLFFYDTDGHLIEQVQLVAPATNREHVRSYVYLEDELMAVADHNVNAGIAAASVVPGIGWHLDPRLAMALAITAAALAAGFATRRWPVGLATAGSGVSLVLLCATGPPLAVFAMVHTDPLGTPIAVTRAPATFSPADVIWAASYEPYGQTNPDENPDHDTALFSLAVRFPGQYADAETGYYFNMYRTYDPSTGRYLETDPIGLDGGLNLYEYAAGNPIALSDPTGTCPWCAAAALGALTDLGIQLAFNGFNFKCVDWTEVAVSGIAAGVGIGLAQKLTTPSIVFRGPSRPTYRFLRTKWIRLESHPTSRGAPNWASYPHWHADFAGKPLSKLHLPLTEPLVGIPAAAHNYAKDDCECSE